MLTLSRMRRIDTVLLPITEPRPCYFVATYYAISGHFVTVRLLFVWGKGGIAIECFYDVGWDFQGRVFLIQVATSSLPTSTA